MFRYPLWVRTSQTTTANTIVFADNDYAAKQLGEAQCGIRIVLGYTRIFE
jgi:hypothetical protein